MVSYRWVHFVVIATLLSFLAVSTHATTYDLNTYRSYDLNIIGGAASDAIGNGGITTADLDDDGNLDLIINSYLVDFNGNTDVGAVYIIFNINSRRGTMIDLNASKSPLDFNIGIFGSTGSDDLGFNGTGIGDIDRDGKRNDIAIGAVFADPASRSAAGAVYVFRDINSESGIINLALPAGRSKVDLNIIGATAGDNIGWAQTSFGDSNADGYMDDLVLGGQGVTHSGNSSAGCVYLINGVGSKLGATIDLGSTNMVNLKVCGDSVNDAMGYTGNFFADYDLDGNADDWVFGEWQGSSATTEALQIIKSAGFESGTLLDTNAIIDLNILGTAIRQSFCIRNCLFADADNDGNSDDFFLTAGAASPLSRSNAGQLYVFNDIRNDGTVINLGNNTGRSKIDLNILGSVASDNLGWGGIALGDLDSDGAKETLAITAYGADPLGRSAAGTIYLIGSISTKSGIIDLNNPGSNVDHTIIGLAGDNLGFTTPHFADVDEDGYVDDLFVGGTGADPPGRSGAGAIWLLNLGGAGTVNASPDVNVWKIDGNPITQPLPLFSYTQDGNITIDLNVLDDRNYLILDLNYSTSTTQGTGTSHVNDLNLSLLPTSGGNSCADTNFTDTTRCSIDINFSGIADGNYYILALVTDGNSSDYNTSGISFMVDQTNPVLTISSPTTGSSNTGSSVTVTYSATDSGAGVASYSVSTDGNSYTSNSTETSYTFTGLSTGSVTLYVRALDGVGNADVESVTITITAATSSSSTSSSSSSGGTGYASPPLAAPFIPAFERTGHFFSTPAGESLHLRFGKNYVHPVTSVSLLSPQGFGPVAMTISTEGKFPPLEEATPCDYFNISPAKAFTQAFTATVRFRVDKECVGGTGTFHERVKLFHYADNQWNPLPTEMEIETEDEYYFASTTTGFSPFASGVESLAEIIPPNPTNTSEPILPAEENTLPAIESISSPSIVQEESQWGWIVIGLLIVVALHYAHYHHKKRKRKGKELDVF